MSRLSPLRVAGLGERWPDPGPGAYEWISTALDAELDGGARPSFGAEHFLFQTGLAFSLDAGLSRGFRLPAGKARLEYSGEFWVHREKLRARRSGYAQRLEQFSICDLTKDIA